jgi:putative aldouronate transport system substrate-binding protein
LITAGNSPFLEDSTKIDVWTDAQDHNSPKSDFLWEKGGYSGSFENPLVYHMDGRSRDKQEDTTMEKRSLRVLSPLLCIALLVLTFGCAPAQVAPTAEEVPPTATAVEKKAVFPTAAPTATAAETPTPVSKAVDETDPFGKFETPVRMTVMSYLRGWTEEEYKASPWISTWKDVFNLEIEYEFLAPQGDQYTQGVNLRMASGDLPDVMNVSLTQMHQMIDAGLLQPLTDVWNDYASEQAKEMMTADTTFPFDVATVDGELYGIPWVNPVLETTHALFLNEQWRVENNLPKPETWEDFEEIIYAFASNDPNGNGEKDEYGLGLCNDLYDFGYEMTSVANAFGAYPNAWIVHDQGDVVYGSVQPEMKPVLAKLAQYYADGLIDPEFIVKDRDTAAELTAELRVGAIFGIQWTGLMGGAVGAIYRNTEDKNSLCWDPSMESNYPLDPATVTCAWEVYPIPSVDGEETSPIVYDNSRTWMVVNKDFEYPEAVVRIANYMHWMGRGPQGEGPPGHPELAITFEDWDAHWGNWTNSPYSPETVHANMARWEHWFQAMKDGDTAWIDNNYLARDQYYQMTRWYEMGDQVTDNYGEVSLDTAAWQFVYRLCGQTFMYSKSLAERDMLTYDVRGSFVSDTMIEKWASLEDLEIQTFTAIITGQQPVDAFDDFVTQWRTLGGDTITDEINQWHSEL